MDAVAMTGKTLKVGDIVTWRKAMPPDARVEPLGISGCKIIAFGQAEDGRPAALIEVMGQQVGAALDDLRPETNS